jgi:ABC-type transport system involved in multi-copper enzyme maturation permease subunit
VTANESTLWASTKAEWIKFRTVRSSVMGVILTFVLIIGLGILVSSLERSHWSQVSTLRQATFDPVSSSLVGILFGQLAVGVIGTLFITSEYSSGSIRTTLTAAPNRLRLITSKLLVLFVTILLVGEVVCVAAFLIGQKIYFGVVPTASLDNGAVLRSVLLAGVYLSLLGVLGFSLGLIFRQSGACISLFVTLLLVVPIIGFFFPQSWQNDFQRFEPSTLGQSMFSPSAPSNSFGAWTATIVLTAYVLVILVIALTLFDRRDAGAVA